MPRFVQSKYDPRNDSTAGFKDVAATSGCVVLNTKRRSLDEEYREQDRPLGCPCGCEGEPAGGKTTFLMGHDARLRGKLIRAHLTGTKVLRLVDGADPDEDNQGEDAMAVADEYGQSFVDALRAAEDRRAGVARQVVQNALNSKRLVKVGRWEYTGQVMAIYDTPNGEDYEMEYVTRMGERKRTRVPKERTQEVAS
jgi:hypothetical protein